MGPPVPVPLLVALAGAAAAGALLVLPRLSNVSYTFSETRCQLRVSWNPAEGFNGSCELGYHSLVIKNGRGSSNLWSPNPSRTLRVAPGKNVVFGVRTSCMTAGQGEGELFTISLPQNGTADTGATNVECIWHYPHFVACSWQRGKNTAHDTRYNLSFWSDVLKEEQPCTNYTREGDSFRCTFNFNVYSIDAFSISIRGNSRDIQPVCIVKDLEDDLPKKFDPPSIINITKSSDGVSLTWTHPVKYAGMCYEVEVNNTKSNKTLYEDNTRVTISLKPNAYHTFRVRTILGMPSTRCTETCGLWSEWSNIVYWDERDNTFYQVLWILIPLCVAVLTIIVLVYLNRIKMQILPTIPDPGKFLKRMFEEQSEDLQKPFTEEPVKDEQTNVLIFIKPPRYEN